MTAFTHLQNFGFILYNKEDVAVCGHVEKRLQCDVTVKLITDVMGNSHPQSLRAAYTCMNVTEPFTCILDSSYSFLVGGGPWLVGDERLGWAGGDVAAVLVGPPPPN